MNTAITTGYKQPAEVRTHDTVSIAEGNLRQQMQDTATGSKRAATARVQSALVTLGG